VTRLQADQLGNSRIGLDHKLKSCSDVYVFMGLQGFVAQKGPWSRSPLARTDLSYSNGSRYAESSISVENCSTDLIFRDLSVEVTSHGLPGNRCLQR
jgi:hypothetical protein